MFGKRFVSIFIITILFVSLVGCGNRSRYVIPEGTFSYTGEPVNFYDDLIIDEMSMYFTEIPRVYFDGSDFRNVLKTKDDKTYSVIFEFKYLSETSPKQYSFQFLGPVGNRTDSYEISLDIDNDQAGIKGSLDIIISFLGDIGGNTDYGTTAGRITLSVKIWDINDEIQSDKFISFPDVLYIS